MGNTQQVFSTRLKVDGTLIDRVLNKYDFKHMTKGEAEDGLTEKQIKFCREYLRLYNVTQAAINAGYAKTTAHVIGSKEVRRLRCVRYICWLKYRYERESHYDSIDMINKLVAIINADATDYAEFGTKESLVTDRMGNPVIVNGTPLKTKQSFLRLKDNKSVDGSLIQEIGWGKGGPYIKFFDKLKAMEVLGQFSPMTNQTKMQMERLELEKEKVALQKAQFLFNVKQKESQSKQEESVKTLKEKMELRMKQRELDRNSDKRINEREQIKQEGQRPGLETNE